MCIQNPTFKIQNQLVKISGFTFIRNAITYDYPIVEAIQSILPICDEVIVAVGKSEDATLDLIKSINPTKIKIIETVWDDSLRAGGKVLADETDKAFKAIAEDTDWAFYIQGDEVVHEEDLEKIKEEMLRWKDAPKVDGLLFNYRHFYGSYDYVGTNSRWYPHEIRIIKNRSDIFSYQDAQGFRKGKNEKLNVKPIDAFIHHYGWVKEPEIQQKKRENFNKYWHSDDWMDKNVHDKNDFSYEEGMHSLTRFKGTHPQVMHERIAAKNWKLDRDISVDRTTLKEKLKGGIKKYTGLDFSYRNYRILR